MIPVGAAPLAERKSWVSEIGAIKKEHGIAVLQMELWKELLAEQTAEAERLGLSTEFVKALCAPSAGWGIYPRRVAGGMLGDRFEGIMWLRRAFDVERT